MRSFRGTAVFAAVVLAITGFAIYEFKKGEEEKKQEVVAGHLIQNLIPSDVEEFVWTANGQTQRIVQKENQWSITSPVEDFSDDEIMRDILNGLSTQTVEEVPHDAAIEWGKFGLQPPAHEILLKLKSGKEEKIQIGSVRTFNDGYYLRLNNKEVLYVATSGLSSYIDKSPQDFRSRYLRLPRGAWTQLQVNSTQKEKVAKLDFVQSDTGWVSSKNKSWRLLVSAFADYERNLKDLKAAEIASEGKSAKDLGDFYLQRPELKINVTSAEKSIEIIFSAAKEGQVYYTATDHPVIYKTAVSSIEPFFKMPQDFRDRKYPFQFKADEVHLVRVKNASSATESAYRKDGLAWIMENISSDQKLKETALTELLKSLNVLEISDFPSKKPTGVLRNEIELKDVADKTLLKLVFGQPYKVKDNEFFYVLTQAGDEHFGLGRQSLQSLLDKKLTEAVEAPTDSKEK